MSSGGERNVEELKSLVVHTLETNGVLGKIRAELRAHVYKAIDREEQFATGASPKLLKKLPDGRLMAEIVREFFEFYDFKHSLSVFLPESSLGKEARSRQEIALEAGLPRAVPGRSILEQILELVTGSEDTRKGEGWLSSASSTTASTPPLQQLPAGVAGAPPAAARTAGLTAAPLPVPPSPGAGGAALTRQEGETALAAAAAGFLGAAGAGATAAQTPLLAAAAEFDRIDRNSDGVITRSEYNTAMGGGNLPDDTMPEARKKPDRRDVGHAGDAPEESGRERRKPLKNTPSNPASPSGAAAKAQEESMGEASVAMSCGSFEEREDLLQIKQLDRQMARQIRKTPLSPLAPVPDREADFAHLAPLPPEATSQPRAPSPELDRQVASQPRAPSPELDRQAASQPPSPELDRQVSSGSASAGSGPLELTGPARPPPGSASVSPANSSSGGSPALSPAHSAVHSQGEASRSPEGSPVASQVPSPAHSASYSQGGASRSPEGSPAASQAASPEASPAASHRSAGSSQGSVARCEAIASVHSPSGSRCSHASRSAGGDAAAAIAVEESFSAEESAGEDLELSGGLGGGADGVHSGGGGSSFVRRSPLPLGKDYTLEDDVGEDSIEENFSQASSLEGPEESDHNRSSGAD